MSNINCNFWKRALLFSFLTLINRSFAQKILRNSDYKEFESVVLVNNNEKKILDKENFKTTVFKNWDKILYNDKAVEFAISNDTLFFFDKVKEIEEVEILDIHNKIEKTVRSKKKNASAEIFANNRIGTFIKINTTKKTFIKSFTVLQRASLQGEEDFEGTLQIQLLKNSNGLPDDSAELLSFEKKIPEIENNKWSLSQKWEITLPQIIQYPKEGFFIVFYLKSDKKHTVALNINDESPMYMFYPNEGWKKLSFNSYYYQLKVLQ